VIGMKTHGLSHRLLATAATVVLLAGRASADDVLLLRDGTHKRGVLSLCDQGHCRIGSETVARNAIAWIGLDRDAPTPPAARDPARDEVHLVDRTVQAATLLGVDPSFIHATLGGRTSRAASSLPRKSVAWIYLRPPPPGSAATPAAPPQTMPPVLPPGQPGGGQATDGDPTQSGEQANRGPWRFPARLYIAVPARCPSCTATLHVLDFKTDDDMILLEKSRTISISSGSLTGNWHSYDPPVPVFPATTHVARFSFDGRLRTNVTNHFYSHSRTRQPGPPPGGPVQSYEGPKLDPEDSRRLGETFAAPGVATPEEVVEWWQDRIAEDWEKFRAAHGGGNAGGGNAGGATGGCDPKQHSTLTGQASYHHHLVIQNWPIIAADRASRPGPKQSSYEKLRRIPVYDVQFNLRFEFGDHGSRGRTVDGWCYTTDTVRPDSTGARLPLPDNSLDGWVQRPSRQQGQTDSGAPADSSLLGRQVRSAREGAERLWEPVERAREALAGVSRDLQRGRPSFEQTVRNAMGSNLFGEAPASRQGTSPGGPPHAVSVNMRWFRKSGDVTEWHGDILAHAVEGQAGQYGDIFISPTRPAGTFDMPAPPGWTPSNPRPPGPQRHLHWGRP
jgi:hypothetical protein